MIDLAMPTTHTLDLQPTYYAAIANNLKTVEGRLRTPKYASIQPSDRIVFRTNTPDANGNTPELERLVAEVRVFATYREMLEACGLHACLPGCVSMDAGVQVYKNIYQDRPAGEAEYGVIGISLAEDRVR